MGRKKMTEIESVKEEKKEKLEVVEDVNLDSKEETVDSTPDQIILNENEILRYQLINTQFSLVKKSIENVDIQKKMYLTEQKTVLENFSDFKKDISEKYKIDYSNYVLDIERERLVKKLEQQELI